MWLDVINDTIMVGHRPLVHLDKRRMPLLMSIVRDDVITDSSQRNTLTLPLYGTGLHVARGGQCASPALVINDILPYV